MHQTKRMLKHSSIYAIGNLSRQLVGFVMLPVYTRYLSPADYGVVGLLISMVTLIELVFGARMFHAVPKFYYEQKDPGNAHRVISTSLMITALASMVTVAATVGFRDPISGVIFGTADHGLLVGLFSLLILTQGLENYCLGYIRIQQRPWLFISATSAKLVLQLTLNIVLVVVLEMGVLGVAISSVTSALIFVLALTTYTLWSTGLGFSRHIAGRMLAFSWPLWLSGLAALYIGSSNRYYIRIFSSLDDVGLFELAAKFGTMIALLVWMPFSQYWQTERFNVYHQPNPVPIYQSVFRFISTLLIMVALGVAIFGAPAVRIMAAPEFHAAAQAIPFLAFSSVFHCFVYFNNFSFLVKEKTGWMTRNTYLTAVFATAFYLALTPVLGFVGAALALMLANATQFLIVHFAAKKQYDMCLSLRPVGFYLAVSVVCCVLAFRLEQPNLIQDIALKVVIYMSGCALMLGSLLLKPEVRDYLAGLIQERRFLRSRL
ncbi:lipopolysaccharide biosynthesis protein [Gilvimarinus sp. F26214L]|uniref:lipopolysaccharide biosynthesis protein n=1 Tax=Gilvimarinus sp. DZF01 TaxID=3461371 RepID=UPI004045637C